MSSKSILLLLSYTMAHVSSSDNPQICSASEQIFPSTCSPAYHTPANENITNEVGKNNTSTPVWETYSFLQMHEYLDCSEHIYRTNKPLYTPDVWKRMRDLFAAQAEMDVSFKLEDTHRENYYASYAEEPKGRGTFAARNFSKGELVHDGAVSTVFWNDGLLWKEYFMKLPQEIACDVMEWTWIQEVEDYGSLLCLNLNDAAFMNHDDEFNIAPKSSYSLRFYAVRDIIQGEELTYDYDIYDTDWDEFDL